MNKDKKVIRQLHKIDASDKVIGRMATEIANVLRGKNKPEYQPNMDLGDSVEVENIKEVRFTGTKLDNKKYYHHSGYPGGLKTTKLKDMLEKNPAEVLKKAVWNMLPKNKLRSEMIKRLIIK
ncbi:50S ribosomal protein L13 [Candidatus Falkowbacteria bacterium CG10_big_fil_rev_8_21_14_0_10_37_6]|uniref:Large ribosomal subunit protein uL13 n=1 Tax=Candidatus Falkowbacteria bacterium CG10_big_fil_rev_8_21_14_0_10_37_6 TaxID=1974563 RepID=A0A2H0V6S2_9BACT|nr:MAG: 50S ribosomal protein L13 [Candidatus Falkowbacteria bacterium CG10_big_fil_rev_8_21_14_0_10_37_6]